MMKSLVFLLISFLLSFIDIIEAGRHHNNNNKLMELLTAGIVAKVLQKQEGHEGGHHEYIPVPIHVPMHHHHGGMHHSESQRHHHHVTEKIIPIPIPHHTTRIIHINAGSNGNSLGGDSDSHSGGTSFDSGSYSNSQNQYDNRDHDDNHNHQSGSSPSIQQIFFQDTGVYGPSMTQTPVAANPYRQQTYMAYRRPAVGMIPVAGMMPAAAAHPAYLMRSRYPYVAVRHRMPYPVAAPTQYGAPMYAIPYRRIPAAASYVNPMVLRRPTTSWYG